MVTQTLNDHIEITHGIGEGKPHIKGRRISVQDIVIWHERLGLTADFIATEHDLSLSEIYAALTYYYDHREQIDRSIKEGNVLVHSLQMKIPSKLKRKLSGRRD